MADLSLRDALLIAGSGSGGSGGKDGVGIASLEINDSGELVVTLDNGRVKNLGRIVGADGAVYVPHIDDKKVLSFTIEKAPDKVPDPVDLNGDGVKPSDVTTDEEVNEMLGEVFGEQSGDGTIDENQVVTDAEVAEMLKEVFGR
ncbi:hypothetical protein D3Z52_17930 [Clostridiaceae bacterium]|nr:hypothetical protein [Clostridiaceae bacterium]NBH80007.1 hypothetical protein [Clostridiaceae bacterium]